MVPVAMLQCILWRIGEDNVSIKIMLFLKRETTIPIIDVSEPIIAHSLDPKHRVYQRTIIWSLHFDLVDAAPIVVDFCFVSIWTRAPPVKC